MQLPDGTKIFFGGRMIDRSREIVQEIVFPLSEVSSSSSSWVGTTRGLRASGRLFLWAVRVSSVFRYTGNQLITPTLQTAAAIKCIATQWNAKQCFVKFHEVCPVQQSEQKKKARWPGFKTNTILAIIQRYKTCLGETCKTQLAWSEKVCSFCEPEESPWHFCSKFNSMRNVSG